MPFDLSVTKPIEYQPWRYTTPPTYNPDGTEATPGVKETLAGVFIMLDDKLIASIRAALPAIARPELDGWKYPVTAAQAAEWNLPVWSGDSAATYFRIPTTVWTKWDAAVPAKVKQFFGPLHREAI